MNILLYEWVHVSHDELTRGMPLTFGISWRRAAPLPNSLSKTRRPWSRDGHVHVPQPHLPLRTSGGATSSVTNSRRFTSPD